MKIGDKIIIEPKHSFQKERYRSKVLEMDGDTFCIDYPLNERTNKTIFLTNGSQLKITYRSSGTVYIFDTEVLGKMKADIPLIQLVMPEKKEHIKIQRREYVRIRTSADVAVHSHRDDFSPFTAVTSDVSAGGAAIYLPKGKEMVEGSMLSLWMALPLKNGEIHFVKLDCELVRVIREEDDTRFDMITVKFINMKNEDRQNLLRYCFEKQLENRKKGIS